MCHQGPARSAFFHSVEAIAGRSVENLLHKRQRKSDRPDDKGAFSTSERQHLLYRIGI
jgi:hypothetical protein